jgi:protocatechuate 3,4-dioxygenase beta subunit
MRSIILLLCIVSSAYPQQGLTNDRCDDDNENLACCFINAPSRLTSVLSIAGRNEPGDRLKISGRLVKADGSAPFPGVTIYAYHTDTRGIYPKKGDETGIHKWHGYLHAWGVSDANGAFEIRSIRPAQYPSRDIAAHIHLVVKEPKGAVYYINEIQFADDPLVTDRSAEGVVALTKDRDGVWNGSVELRLKK